MPVSAVLHETLASKSTGAIGLVARPVGEAARWPEDAVHHSCRDQRTCAAICATGHQVTGSYPPLFGGLHLSSRDADSLAPFHAPCLCNASTAYTEHDGV